VDGSAIATLIGHSSELTSASFNPDGMRIVTTARDDLAPRLWDGETGSAIATLIGHSSELTSASFNPDGTRIVTTARDDPAPRLWDGEKGAFIATLGGHPGEPNLVRFSSQGMRIVTAAPEDSTPLLWNGLDGSFIRPLKGHTDALTSVEVSPDGTRFVTAGKDREVRVWYAVDGSLDAILRGHTDAVNSASYSPDGTRILTASSDRTVRLWDLGYGSPIMTLEGHPDEVMWASFSADGMRILAHQRSRERWLWNAIDGTLVSILETSRLAYFSPDGSHVVTQSGVRTQLWDAVWGYKIAVFGEDILDSLRLLRFNVDGTRFVTITRSSEFDPRRLSPLWLGIGLFVGLLAGLRGGPRETTVTPNQGIRLSARNAVIGGIAGALLITPLLLMSGAQILQSLPVLPLLTGLLGLVFVLGALWQGGFAVIHHLILRFILTTTGCMPWNCVSFLDYASERIFLRKVGGGYIFIHRLLMDYFASRDLKGASE
jgi:hypothetical protein